MQHLPSCCPCDKHAVAGHGLKSTGFEAHWRRSPWSFDDGFLGSRSSLKNFIGSVRPFHEGVFGVRRMFKRTPRGPDNSLKVIWVCKLLDAQRSTHRHTLDRKPRQALSYMRSLATPVSSFHWKLCWCKALVRRAVDQTKPTQARNTARCGKTKFGPRKPHQNPPTFRQNKLKGHWRYLGGL